MIGASPGWRRSESRSNPTRRFRATLPEAGRENSYRRIILSEKCKNTFPDDALFHEAAADGERLDVGRWRPFGAARGCERAKALEIGLVEAVAIDWELGGAIAEALRHLAETANA